MTNEVTAILLTLSFTTGALATETSATDRVENPSFSVTKREGRLLWKRLEANPLPLPAPC